LPLCLQMKPAKITPLNHAGFPAKEGNHLIGGSGGPVQAVIIGHPKVPLNPPNSPCFRGSYFDLVRLHLSEQ
jgi:hypothetical protein